MRRLIAIVVVILMATPAYAKDCTITSVGLAPSTYVRSSTHHQNGLLAATRIVRRAADGSPSSAGRVAIIGIGMSNAATYFVPERREIKEHPYRTPGTVFIKAAQSGKTAKEWSDVNNNVWARALYSVQNSGHTPLQVQAARVYMTNAFPATNGAMHAGHLEAIVMNLKHYFPNLQIVYLSPIGYTGYAKPYDSRAPVEYVRGDVTLMEEMVGAAVAWPPGVWVDLLDIWSDGIRRNPLTASKTFPQGIDYQCADLTTDGIHPVSGVITPVPTGAQKIGINVVERLYADPVTKGWLFR